MKTVITILVLVLFLAGGAMLWHSHALAPSTPISPAATTTETTNATGTPPASGGGTPAPTLSTGVRGSVLLGPTCPVERVPPDPACADKPYQTAIIAHAANGAIVGHTESNSSGAFSFALPPGTYTLSAVGGKLLPRCADASVTIPKSGYISATISCDTGIR